MVKLGVNIESCRYLALTKVIYISKLFLYFSGVIAGPFMKNIGLYATGCS